VHLPVGERCQSRRIGPGLAIEPARNIHVM
jgi:hypothetical protein